MASLVLIAGNSLSAQHWATDGFTLGVEPICQLAFANIDNVSSTTSSAPAHEDFTAVVAQVERGETYTVTASGITGGTPPNRSAANFDRDGAYTFETHVELGDIVVDNCNGESYGSFTVPMDAAIGLYRVRFLRTFSYSATDNGCLWSSSYGQSDDHTIEVVSMSVGVPESALSPVKLYPDPGAGTSR